MSLRTLKLDTPDLALPSTAQQWLQQEARARAEFALRAQDAGSGGFQASDYARVYATLHALSVDARLRGRTFCEWGSGTGVVCQLASLVGFDSYGIEIQARLVELACRLEGAAVFTCGTFVPGQAVTMLPHVDDTFLDGDGSDGHHALGLEPGELDVVYCYPWPEEEELVEQLFDLCATPGAILVTYRGHSRLTVQQRQPIQAQLP